MFDRVFQNDGFCIGCFSIGKPLQVIQISNFLKNFKFSTASSFVVYSGIGDLIKPGFPKIGIGSVEMAHLDQFLQKVQNYSILNVSRILRQSVIPPQHFQIYLKMWCFWEQYGRNLQVRSDVLIWFWCSWSGSLRFPGVWFPHHSRDVWDNGWL